MKRATCIVMIAVLLFSIVSCSGNEKKDSKYDALVNQAIDLLKTKWKEVYQGSQFGENGDQYLEIKNTRVITIKENENEYFKDIKSIVDFMIYDNFIEYKPTLYQFNNIYYQVIFYRDGHTEVPEKDYFTSVSVSKFVNDFSDVIESVEDLGEAYNAVFHLETGEKAEQASVSAEKDPAVDQAVGLLKQQWTKTYHDEKYSIKDGYLEIKNTRIITIRNTDIDPFKEIEKIVDFAVLDNYFNYKPSLYQSSHLYCQVVFYRDGHTEVSESDIIKTYSSKKYDTDFEQIIESVRDLGGIYNEVYHF